MKVGLALSGGVIRGSAHIGVVEMLQQAGIPIDVVAGSSAGAIVGTMVCSGMSTAEMRLFALELGWANIARPTLSRRGIITFRPMERLINLRLRYPTFADMKIPFNIVATDLNSGTPYVFREGLVSTAVHASSAIPGVVAPIRIDDMILCDGGVANNCPVNEARRLGADYVIAVDLFAPSRLRFGSLGVWLTSIETLVRSSGGGIYDADCLILPDVAGTPYFDFSKTDEFIAIGRQAASRVIDKIKQDLGKLQKISQEKQR